jgi:hypothetical protein
MNKARQQGFIRRLWIMWHGRAMAMPALRWVVKRDWILLRSFIRMNLNTATSTAHDLNHVQDIQKGLQQSVQALN